MHRFASLFLLILAAALLSSPFTAAAQEQPTATPRVIAAIPTTFAAGAITFITMPDSGDGINMDNDFTEAGETAPSCTKVDAGIPRIGNDSAWFALYHPGGTLDINTAYATGSNFDSIVQVFAYDTLDITNLREVACDDDGGLGANGNDARILKVLPSAPYIVRIACLNCSVGYHPTDLALEVRFIPPVSATPLSDNVANLTPILFSKPVKVNNIQFATVDATENTTLGCPMQHTVWYRFVAPRSGAFTFSTFGSLLNQPYQLPDTKLAVYSSSGGAVYANMTQLGCSDNSLGTVYASLSNITISLGTEVYIRVGTFSPSNFLGGSYYRVTVSPESMSGLAVNNTFDSGTTGWTLKGTTGADGVISDLGNNVFRFIGASNKTAAIKQAVTTSSLLLNKVEAGSTFRLFFTYSTLTAPVDRAKIILTLTYSDGRPPTKVSFKPLKFSNGYQSIALMTEAASKKVAKVIMTVKNSSAQGDFRVDSISVSYTGNPARLRSEKAALPLPAPAFPDGFRGGN